MYRLNMFVDENMSLEIEHSNFVDLLAEFEKMGGDRDWLLNTAKSAVAASLNGEAVRTVVRALGGEVLNTEYSNGAAPAAAEEVAPPPPGPSDDDPWGNSGSNASPAPAEGDPWGGGGGNAAPAQTQQSAPPAQQQQTQVPANDSGGGIEQTTDKYGREWTTNLPDAPNCNCGIKAVRMKAKAKGSGKVYSKWKCAKGNSPDYKNKCAYDEFPS